MNKTIHIISPKLHKPRIYWTWLISYLLIMALLLGVWLGSISLSRKIILDQTRQLNENRMNLLSELTKTACAQVTSATLYAATDATISRLIQRQERSETQDMWDVKNTIRFFQDLKQDNDAIYELILYFREGDFIITSSTVADFPLYYQMNLSQTGYTLNEMQEFLHEDHHWRYFSMKGFDNQNTSHVCCTVSLPPKLSGKAKATFIVLLKPSVLNNLIATVDLNDETRIWIENPDHEIFAENFAEKENPKNFEMSITGENGWRYCMQIPERIFLAPVTGLEQSIFYSAAGITLICLAVSLFFIYRNYMPLRELTSHLEDSLGTRKKTLEENEYVYLKDSLQAVLDERQKSAQLISRQQQQLKSSYLLRLIHGHTDPGIDLEEYLALLQISYTGSTLAVILLEDSAENVTLLYEACCKQELMLCALEGERVICLAECVQENKPASMLHAALSPFFPDLTVAVSQLHKGIPGIAQAYDEALYALEYSQASDSGAISFYAQLYDTVEKPSYNYSPEIERQLMYAINAGKAEDALKILNALKKEHTALYGTDIRRLFLIDILSTLVKLRGESASLLRPIYRAGADDFEGVWQELFTCTEELCEKSRQDHSDNALKDQIIDYIQKHYSDPQMGVEDICQEFGRSRTHLFNLFKETTGSGLMNHITDIRISAAKKLLAAGHSVTATAQAVGYANVNTFMRAFKKQTGVAPSNYKELLWGNENSSSI